MLCCPTTTCLGSICIKESHLGYASVIVTPEALTLCCSTTACLGSTYIKVSRLGYALAIVTPEDVLINSEYEVVQGLWCSYPTKGVFNLAGIR
jgi:hypothetical protein